MILKGQDQISYEKPLVDHSLISDMLVKLRSGGEQPAAPLFFIHRKIQKLPISKDLLSFQVLRLWKR